MSVEELLALSILIVFFLAAIPNLPEDDEEGK